MGDGVHDLVIKGGTVVDGLGTPRHTADVAVDDGRITEVGTGLGAGKREVEADGLVVAPGWVDIHTHYDGQVTWDPDVSPSSWHGTTTVVMGNCGVGFAPVRPGEQGFLIELMEGVEDIPGTALHEGMDWAWESFPEYLDALDRGGRVGGRAIDIAAQVPHAALRAYVMGERAHDDTATVEDVELMSKLTEEALRAGAVGFTTSRTILHRSKHGLVPGTTAPIDELAAIADAIGRAGKGVLQVISDGITSDEQQAFLAEVTRRNGCTSTYSLAQDGRDPWGFVKALDHAGDLQARGVNVVPQVPRPSDRHAVRPPVVPPPVPGPRRLPAAAGPAAGREGGPTAGPGAAGPADRRRPVDRQPHRRPPDDQLGADVPLGDPPDYEPPASASAEAVAKVRGCTPQEVVLDWLLERNGEALLFSPLGSYVERDHEAIRAMIEHPAAVVGLSDGGAHCGLICDVSFPTYLLTHWVNGRARPSPRSRAGGPPADLAHRRRLRDDRPRPHRRRRQGRPQPHRPRRHGPPRPGDALGPPGRRQAPRAASRRVRRHLRGRRGDHRGR